MCCIALKQQYRCGRSQELALFTLSNPLRFVNQQAMWSQWEWKIPFLHLFLTPGFMLSQITACLLFIFESTAYCESVGLFVFPWAEKW